VVARPIEQTGPDIDKMAAVDRFELLLGTVVPRLIAIITTISRRWTMTPSGSTQLTKDCKGIFDNGRAVRMTSEVRGVRSFSCAA
jgi:hypothetical protein